ncbi:MAG: metallophosphoesterase N-terminal domain-containing protein [Pirellulaceae bacterium]
MSSRKTLSGTITQPLQLLLSLTCLLANQPALSRAHDGHAHPAASHSNTNATKTARGVVFEDLNGNRVRDTGEAGLPDIRVSNGADIVSTDADGKYELSISDDAIVFVIKPSGWSPPLNSQKLPQFYYIHKPKGSPADFQFAGVAPTGPLPESIDFPLTRQLEPQKFKALMFGDPQPRDIREVEYIAHDVIEQVIAEHAHDASLR